MKIIVEDNFNRDYISDYVYIEHISQLTRAVNTAKALNAKEHDSSPSFFRAVEDDYKLNIFEP